MPGLDPVVYFFLFGLLAGLSRAELRLPQAIYEFVSTLLLLSIGMKGGIELARQPIGSLAAETGVVILMGVTLTLLAFAVLRFAGRFERPDAAALAAHYGSVSVGTFAVGVAYLAKAGIPAEPYMALFLVVLEVPGIVVGILLARGLKPANGWGPLLHEVFLGKGVVLLLGGLVIGWLAGEEGLKPLSPLFMDLFKGILALFLLEMGLIAAGHLGGLQRRGLFLVPFAVLVPVLFGGLGLGLAWLLDLSRGGAILLATLAASASYIAAPAAMRNAVPQANPALSLTASLGITFPFNILVGIPLYHQLSGFLYT